MFGFGEDKTVGEEEKQSTPWAGTLKSALADARKGHVSHDSGDATGTKKAGKKDSGSNLSTKVQEQLEKLFQPSAWEPIVKAPFAFMQAMTGRECWEPSKKEVDTLSTMTSTAMEYVAITDPKILAIGMCVTTWAMIFGEKLILSAREAKKEQALAEAQNPLQPTHLVK